MKAWEPEEIFEKADFPVKKPGAGRSGKPGSDSAGKPGSARSGNTRPAAGSGGVTPAARVPRPPSAGQPPSPNQNTRPGAAWEPDLDFERADFSGISPEEAAARGDSRSSSDAMANVAAGRPGPAANPGGTPGQARTWQPPKLSKAAERAARPDGSPKDSEAATDSARAPKIVGSRIRQGPGAPGSAPAAIGSDRNSAAPDAGAGVASGFSRRLLEELTILHRENARHILRHWYWEKAGMAPEGLGHIAPHERIYMILSGLGSQVLMVLYESMSPTERRQMQEILNRPPNVTVLEANRVRTTFMQLLRAEV